MGWRGKEMGVGVKKRNNGVNRERLDEKKVIF